MINSRYDSIVASYYESRWQIFEKWWCAYETLGIHHAYYEKGIHNFKQAIYNMNNLVGRLLSLNDEKPLNILDAGCGVGGTSIYLAKKYPNVRFTGITITPDQVQLAKKFIAERNVKNVEVTLGDYCNTQFPDNFFDGVFALESACYAEKIQDFVAEMYRILKPGGKLVVIDGFRKKIPSNPLIQRSYDIYMIGRGFQNRNIPLITAYYSYLKREGFSQINIEDISKNIAHSHLRSVLIGVPFFLSSTLKKVITFGKYNPIKNFYEFSMGVSVLAAIITLNKVFGYYVTAAIKK